MFRVHPLRSLLALLLLASALCLPLASFAQPAPQVCDCDADGDIDKADISLIANARGKAASGPTDPRDPDRDNTITSADARTCTQRCTFPKCGSPTNRLPIADAGPDATVFTGQRVTLDGSDSTDPDGDPLTFAWTFVRKPAGSNATLTAPNSVSPSFTPDVDGIYEFQLIVNDGQVNSAPDIVRITTGNAPPVADAGDDQSAVVNGLVKLDGTGSSDINGDPLTYSWTFASKPQGSTATLSNPTGAMPTFTPDLPGVYVLRLIVNDGKVNSQPDTVRIETGTVPNQRPIADAGDDQTVNLGARVTLDGSGSRDPDNGPSPLTYSWSISTKPAGSAAVLSSTTVVNPMFTADKAGDYVIQLIVNDGADSSAPDTVRITTRNTRPVADAGDDQNRNVGDTVALDGTGSFDADGDPLSYQWSFTSRPAGSTATIANPAQPTTSFVADRPGTYVVQLVVNDGQFDSLPDTARITIVVPTVPSLSVNDASISEGNAGTKLLSFTVTLTPAASANVTVTYATANGSATTADSDYDAKTASLTYTPGQLSKTVTVTVRGDTKFEPDENFFVNLSNVNANATISDGQGVGTIVNDDTAALPVVSITATDANAAEAGPNVGVMRIARSGGNNTLALSIQTTRGGTATNITDYAGVSNTISIPAGAAFVNVTFTPVDDAVLEGNETIIVTISTSSNYTVGTPNSATVNIADNETEVPTVTIVATDAEASEAGRDAGVMRVSRTGSTASQLGVSTNAAGSTASNGVDFSAVNATVTIPAGAAFVDVTFTPLEDTLVEGPETIVRTLNSSATYIVGTPNSATVTIADNDVVLPTVTVQATDANAAEQGQATGTFTISRTGPTTAALQVVGTFSGTASNGSDYSAINGTVTIPIGQSSVTRTITPIDDTTDESDETVIYTIQSGEYNIGAQNTATVTIADNDTATLPTVTASATDSVAGETSPNPGSGRVTFARSGPTASPLTVNFSVGGSATSGSDFTAVGTSVTIAAGQSSAVVNINPIDDSAIEATETVILGILPNAAYTIGSPSAAQVNIADNDVGALVQFVTATMNIAQNLQDDQRLQLSAGVAPAGGLSVRVSSSNPNVLLSATSTGSGAQTLNLTIPANNSQSPAFYVYSLASTGTASLTVEILTTPNPGFSPGTPGSVTLAPVGYELLCQTGGCTILSNGEGIATTAQGAPTQIFIQTQRLSSNTQNNRAEVQNVRGGATISFSLSLTNGNLGVFRAYNNGTPGAEITSLTIPAGQNFTYFFFDPNNSSSGSGTINFTKPAGAGTPLFNSAPYAQSMPVTVTGSTPINFVAPGTMTVGRDLQDRTFFNLGAPAPAGGLTVRLTSNNANVLLSASLTTAGGASVDITVPAGSTQSPFVYVQSLAASGTATVSMQVVTTPNPGFTPGAPLAVTLAPSGFQVFCYQGPGTCGLDTAANRDTLTTTNANTNQRMYIEAYRLNPNSPANNIVFQYAVRGGFTVTVPVTLTNPNVGTLRDSVTGGNAISQVSIVGGTTFTYFYFDPNNASTGGNTVINYTKPATAGTPTTGGQPRRQSVAVTVTQ